MWPMGLLFVIISHKSNLIFHLHVQGKKYIENVSTISLPNHYFQKTLFHYTFKGFIFTSFQNTITSVYPVQCTCILYNKFTVPITPITPLTPLTPLTCTCLM